MAVSRAEQRAERERDLVRATRALFDQRGMQDAPIEEIARAVGIQRGQVYRHFSSKDELFVLTVTDYLDELAALLALAVESSDDPLVQAERCMQGFAGFGERYPAFLDCSLSLMQRPATELEAVVAESVWLRLGQGMAACLGLVSDVLRAGRDAGMFTSVEDPDLMANVLWTQMLGILHLARIRIGVRRTRSGGPATFPLAGEDVVQLCVASVMATLGARQPA